jgi:hypothetical protein
LSFLRDVPSPMVPIIYFLWWHFALSVVIFRN